MYVPSHIGIRGNETVDTYAKSATDPSPLKIITSDDIKSYFNQITYTNWQNFWASQTSNKLYELKKTVQPWKNLNHLSRKEEVIITRLRIGHTKLTHNYFYQKILKPICNFCNREPLSVRHLIFICPQLHQDRLALQINENSITIPDSPSEIQKFITLIKNKNLTNQI